MKKEQKFKIGQKVTYKFKYECNSYERKEKYKFGGFCRGGREAIIEEYGSWSEDNNCWIVKVELIDKSLSSFDEYDYHMLESEFKEWNVNDIPFSTTTKSKNKINFSY